MTDAATPRIESRLRRVHRDAEELDRIARQFQAAGVDATALPTVNDRRAFALLGEERPGEDHARRLEPILPALTNRGIVGPGRQTPATARFLLSVAHLVDGLRTPAEIIDARLASGSAGPGPVIVCPARVSGIWGQMLHVPVTVSMNAEYLLVRPDPIFGAGEVIERLDHDRDSNFWFQLPCDHGEVLLAALGGESLSCHTLRVEIA